MRHGDLTICNRLCFLGSLLRIFGLTAFLGLKECPPLLKAKLVFLAGAVFLNTLSNTGPPCRRVHDRLVGLGCLPEGGVDQFVHILHHRQGCWFGC